MLVLARNQRESIIISNNIEVTVLSIKGKQVRLGITAPKEIKVDREEIFQLKKKLKEAKQNGIRNK